jgi:hypothetical protein
MRISGVAVWDPAPSLSSAVAAVLVAVRTWQMLGKWEK